ncbi:MAG: hypothetical protein SGJ21_04615 [Alphaproteobacteria bacterium]|nr:hypothetical protein [Alphaproteobacteria bacterium]
MPEPSKVNVSGGDVLERHASHIAAGDAARFQKVNAEHFGFRHALARQSFFNVPDLVRLSERIPDHEGFKYWQSGDIDVSDGWNVRPVKRLTLRETIEGIALSNSVVVLKHVEQDPVFGPVLRELLQNVFDAAPKAFQDDVTIGECLIFINSPNRKTAYHFDLEPSFLLQVSGEKTAFAWMNGDRTLTTDLELEDYCAGNTSAGVYKPHRQADAGAYPLSPGDGVHFPSTGPHWVQNGDAVSISVNVNFDLRSLHSRLQYAYAVNHRMRKLGLNPTSPGERPWIDSAKAGAWATARQARRLAHEMTGRAKPGDLYPVWRPRR